MSGLVLAERRVLTDLVPGAFARDLTIVAAGAVATGLAAQVSVSIEPLSPVPLTGQTLAVVLVAAAAGPLRALASMALYLLVGVLGVPWFAEGASGSSMVSLGYVIGFLLAGVVVGELARRGGDRTPWRTAATMAAGNIAIYAVGVSYLAVAAHLSPAEALSKGLVPFLVGDALKIAIAAALLPATWSLVHRFKA
jgi:biotin transport system substrate-specific component